MNAFVLFAVLNTYLFTIDLITKKRFTKSKQRINQKFRTVTSAKKCKRIDTLLLNRQEFKKLQF